MPISVVVVDDDPVFRELAVQTLEGMGLAVVGEADTVASGAAAATKLRPQAALVDVALPDGSGVALAAKLAALPWRPRIVLTSSDPDALTERLARSAGAAAFIAKHDLADSPLPALFAERTDQE